MFLVKVTFTGSRQLYSYYSQAAFKEGDEIIVDAPNGEVKVVKVALCIQTTIKEISSMPYDMKPIAGVVHRYTKLPTLQTLRAVEGTRKKNRKYRSPV